MSIHRGQAVTAPLSLTAAAVILTLSLCAQAQSTSIESVSSTPVEALSALTAGQELLEPWTGHLAGKVSKGSARGSRSGKAFTPAGKKEIDATNAAKNDGVNKCESCEVEVVPGQKSQRGVSPPNNQRERDHITPKSKGGDGTPSNGQVLCRECNLEKSDKKP
ncbi:HNH endonuclease [Archangium lansingense]|uniref:HNH endonuclease n=1 Tax=Archangium lansingense TaxID=2995310 RepID=A0ABT4ADN8_9BACT|nr:HNH endonuclease [Archangium lansinium]MCY1079788.1 HNH endonuclease [Archangium lansinium]